MAYNKTSWVNNQAPAINALNLNKMEQGIYDSHVHQELVCDEIPGTVQTYNFVDGTIQTVQHKIGNVVRRTDTFTFGEENIVETRELNTGEVLTITTNLETLQTTVSYSS